LRDFLGTINPDTNKIPKHLFRRFKIVVIDIQITLKQMLRDFLGTINPDTNKIPKHLFQGYLNIYNNYFKAPWMPDRTEANPNELNQDDRSEERRVGKEYRSSRTT